MKILRLDLRAIGPFTDKVLDLSGGAEGLHLVYGDNERGKTSALKALGDMFFGIPQTSPADFVHRYEKMRVGAVIARRDGERLEFLRRKGKKDTLLAADDKTPIDESELRRFIGGSDRQQFEQMFGIDHKALIEGGQAIVRGHGEVGQVLFAAGAGIADLRSIAAAIEKDADERFKPSGSKPKINELLAQWKETTKRIRECQLPSSRWAEHKKAKETAESELEKSDSRYLQATMNRDRLLRIRGALPVVSHRKQLLEQIALHSGAARLSPGFAESRRETVSRLEGSRKNLSMVEQEIARIEQEIAAQVLPEALLAMAAKVEKQYKALGANRQAQEDRPGLVALASEKLTMAQQQFASLRPEGDIATAKTLQLSERQQVEIQTLAIRGEALRQEAKQAKQEIATCERRSIELQTAIKEMPVVYDHTLLAETIASIQSDGNLERQESDLTAEIALSYGQFRIECQNLGLSSDELGSLDNLPAPQIETLERFERILDECDKSVSKAAEAAEKAETDRHYFERQLDLLRAAGELPTDMDLSAAREYRDRLWKELTNVSQNNAIEIDAARAQTYREAVLQADEIVDRLRREVQRVADHARVTVELAAAIKNVPETAGRFEARRADHARVLVDWQQVWQPMGITPLSPREMRSWMQRFDAIKKRAQSLRELGSRLQCLTARTAERREILLRQFQNLDPAQVADKPNSFTAELLAVARTTVKRLEKQSASRDRVIAELEEVGTKHILAQTKSDESATELAEWQLKWTAAIAPLGLAGDTSAEHVAEFILQCNQITKLLGDSHDLEKRVDRIDAFDLRFQEDVGKLLLAIDPGRDLAGLQYDKEIEDLFAALQRAKVAQQAVERLHTDLRRQIDKRDLMQIEINKSQAALDELCREAGCANADELPVIEQRADDAARLKEKLETCEAELYRLAGGTTIVELEAEVNAANTDDISPELDRLNREIGELESARNDLHQKIGGERKALDSMDTTAEAADAAQNEQGILARLETEVAQYLRLRLASAVLKEGIERYRKKNEGPVLSRASELFARLTVGSFDGLTIDLEQQQIVGMRGDDRLGPEAMSEGSCDQLYLALRLASLETWIESHEPLPFIVDDILVSFDDRRSAAALEVLAELSKKTQVIFFAHHRHLVEIAKEAVPAGTLFVHEI